ncbi:hypothetical protein P879_10587 [Paragonimus westermani]|uniref:C2H2-type domain-containing protein n=1 Tax=Paragonimus westermani TaxID=34504 RepID=A0A8T0D2H6_9TREM|nr:hypothetical protein P879_10587 [Paragonimus westermani]
MNFSNQFTDVWSVKFPGASQPPQLNCLKADQFSSLLEQKQALEFEESKRCAVIEELKQQVIHENFIVDFLHKCIQKLGAVCQVFNEIDQSDSKSSSSSGTIGRHPGSTGSPPLSNNGSGMTQSNKFLNSASSSNFPIFPHCIASSLIHSASPLLAAAAATSSPFLLPSSLPSFPCPESIKLDPDPEPLTGRSSNLLLSAADCSSYDAISRLTAPSSLYNNPFTGTNNFSPGFASRHSLRAQSSPFDVCDKVDSNGSRFMDHHNSTPSTTEAQAQAAAAVAAAFGLGFHSVRSGGRHLNLTASCHKQDVILTGNSTDNLILGPNAAHHPSSANGLDNKDTVVDSSVDRPYQCNTCSRSFAVKAGLVQHMRTHTDERPYPCMHCGRAFKQKIQLTTHMRVHSGERPYGCRLCGKLFRQQSHVVQHLRTHTGEKPHKCYQCGKAFRQKYSLISHQRRMCRNRAASNPIAAGMTMWISPGAGGDTCNLVKEFSPTKVAVSRSSPNVPISTPVSVTTSVHSPFSPYVASPPVSTTPTPFGHQATHFQSPSGRPSLDDSHRDALHSFQHHLPFATTAPTTAANASIVPGPRSTSHYRHHRPELQGESSGSTQSHTTTQLDSEEDMEEEEEDVCSPRASSRVSAAPSQSPTALGLI